MSYGVPKQGNQKLYPFALLDHMSSIYPLMPFKGHPDDMDFACDWVHATGPGKGKYAFIHIDISSAYRNQRHRTVSNVDKLHRLQNHIDFHEAPPYDSTQTSVLSSLDTTHKDFEHPSNMLRYSYAPYGAGAAYMGMMGHNREFRDPSPYGAASYSMYGGGYGGGE
jgi:hypothetical protein